MKRRGFLKGLTASAAITPVIALSKPPEWLINDPAVVAAELDYDGSKGYRWCNEENTTRHFRDGFRYAKGKDGSLISKIVGTTAEDVPQKAFLMVKPRAST